MKLLIGLGNPGKEYAWTRHNIGWLAVDRFAQQHEGSFQKKNEFHAEVADLRIGREHVFLLKPLTFMNLSGRSVQAIKNYYKLPETHLLIVHDEMDFPLGKFGFLQKGGAAGHNGIKSIHETLGTSSIARLRLGIGRPTPPLKMDQFVLQPFSAKERKELSLVLDRANEAMLTWITQGLTTAMNSWNGVEYGVDARTDRANESRAC